MFSSEKEDPSFYQRSCDDLRPIVEKLENQQNNVSLTQKLLILYLLNVLISLYIFCSLKCVIWIVDIIYI